MKLPLWAIALSLAFLGFSPALAEPTPQSQPAEPMAVPARVPDYLFNTAYRIRTILSAGIYEYTKYGSGVGVDLENWGYKGKRYILSAAHLVLFDGKVCTTVQIEIRKPEFKSRVWLNAKIVSYDKAMDLVLFVADEDLPYLAKVAQEDKVQIGDPLMAVGAPKGTAITPSPGVLTSKDLIAEGWGNPYLWQGSMPIFFGNSGGPVWDLTNKEVMGIASAIVGKDEKGSAYAPNIAFFVGQPTIKTFLTSNKMKEQIGKL